MTIKNIGIVGHGGTGKTTLTERMLFDTKVINRMGRVEDGNTLSDYHAEEISRQLTINTSLVPIEWKGEKFNFLDTPGFSDFIGEVNSGIRVVENLLFVVCAVSGVEAQAEFIMKKPEAADKAKFIFVNKMDRDNADFYKVLDELKALPGNFAPIQLPIGAGPDFKGIIDIIDTAEDVEGVDVMTYRESLIEAAAEADDELLMKYLDGEELTKDEILLGLKEGITNGTLCPVLCGSAVNGTGCGELLDMLGHYAVAAEDAEGPASGFVFKTLLDPFMGKMSFTRVFKGCISTDGQLYNNSKECNEKVGQILALQGKNQKNINKIECGDFGVLLKLANTTTGDTIGSKDSDVIYDPITYPNPTYAFAISPATKGDEDKLGSAIAKILEEDPTLKLEKNAETAETILTGMGDTHLEVVKDKLKNRYGVQIAMEYPSIPYRETIRTKVRVEGKHKKQSGGHGQYGDCWVQFEPYPDGDFAFEEQIFGGSIPKNYLPAIQKGIEEAMKEGILAGYPVTHVKAIVDDGSYHPVDSSEMAFKIAGSLAFKKGAEKANPTIMEPIMDVTVTVPDKYMGDIIADLNTKRGRILGMDPDHEVTHVRAQVPLSEMYKYTIDLKSMTQGRGVFEMKEDHYEEVPERIQQDLIKAAEAKKQE